ncbi:MAG TPA: nucleotide exchange factor GrpE [Candidatus Atribacteria bacterium]|nr:nucleotide exchange factor GrpE [Candidatus Atribacteria bacterium]
MTEEKEILKEPEGGSQDKELGEVSLSEIEELNSLIEEQKRIIEEKEELISDYLNDLKRLKADFDNFRKRETLFRQDFVKKANRDLISKLLPILDDMERAIREAKAKNIDEAMVQGIELIYRKFLNTLEKEGVKPMETEGQKFDPKYHEAVATVCLPDYEDYEIVEEMRRGYLYQDEVLRPAQVRVNRISEDFIA